MDPELKEKLRVRRLLSEERVAPTSNLLDAEAVANSSGQKESVDELVAKVASTSSTISSDVQPGKVASLRQAHEVMAARTIAPKKPLPGPKTDRDAIVMEPCSSHSKVNYIVHSDDVDGVCAEGASAEPIEYLMLELMPLLPLETAEQLFRAVRADEQRTLRLQNSAEVLRNKIEDGQPQRLKSKPKYDQDESSCVKSCQDQRGAVVQNEQKLKSDRKFHCLKFISFAWLCGGIVLGTLFVVVFWISMNSRGMDTEASECKDDGSSTRDQLSFTGKIFTPASRTWIVRQNLQHVRKHRHICKARQQRLVGSVNRSRSAICRNMEMLAKEQDTSPLQTYALEQRSTLQKLETDIKELRRSAAACRRCALALGLGSSC